MVKYLSLHNLSFALRYFLMSINVNANAIVCDTPLVKKVICEVYIYILLGTNLNVNLDLSFSGHAQLEALSIHKVSQSEHPILKIEKT